MNGDFLRLFSEDTPHYEYVWHRDKKDRWVYVEKCGDAWYYQEDNKEPVLLEKGTKFFIQSMVYHRLIKGHDDLVIRIKEI